MTGKEVEIVLVSKRGTSKSIDPQTDRDETTNLLRLAGELIASPRDLSEKAYFAFTEDGNEREDLEELSKRVAQDEGSYDHASGIALARRDETFPTGKPLHLEGVRR